MTAQKRTAKIVGCATPEKTPERKKGKPPAGHNKNVGMFSGLIHKWLNVGLETFPQELDRCLREVRSSSQSHILPRRCCQDLGHRFST
ncbi:unnamed protein product [Victoria cruziana]